MRRAARRDANEQQIVELFEAHGLEVASLNDTSRPDLIVCWRPTAMLALCEVKAPKGLMRSGQVKFKERFPVWIVRSEADARKLIRWLKRQVVHQMQPQETL